MWSLNISISAIIRLSLFVKFAFSRCGTLCYYLCDFMYFNIANISSSFIFLLLPFSVGPSATGIGQNITVGIGKSQSFGCPVDGNPEPTITWFNTSGKVIYSGKTLNFPSTKLSDTGCYTCSAKNFLGTVNVTHCLVVGKFLQFLSVFCMSMF